LGELDLLSGEDCTPLDAVVLGHQIDFDLATGLSEDHSALIEFLQGASCRVSHRSLDAIQHISSIVTLCEQGLDLAGIDWTCLPDRLCFSLHSFGIQSLSQTACLFITDVYPDSEEVTVWALSLLRAGADMWPFHVEPSPWSPPNGPQTPAQLQVAGILWPDQTLENNGEPLDLERFAETWDDNARRALITSAAEICRARRQQANWERRRSLLLCLYHIAACPEAQIMLCTPISERTSIAAHPQPWGVARIMLKLMTYHLDMFRSMVRFL
jgi:hypothetical protein